MRLLTITLFLFLVSTASSYACTCGGKASFCLSAERGQAILEVEVTKKYKEEDGFKHFVDFKVRETLYSIDSLQYENLTLVEGYSLCDAFLFDDLDIGDRLVMTYYNTREENEANFTAVGFSICSIDYLLIKGNEVEGIIQETETYEPQRMSYNRFKNNLDDLCNIDFLSKASISVLSDFSNNEFIFINNYSTALSFEIFSVSGQLAYKGQLAIGEEKLIDFIDFPSSIYFVRFRNEISQVTLKTAKIN